MADQTDTSLPAWYVGMSGGKQYYYYVLPAQDMEFRQAWVSMLQYDGANLVGIVVGPLIGFTVSVKLGTFRRLLHPPPEFKTPPIEYAPVDRKA